PIGAGRRRSSRQAPSGGGGPGRARGGGGPGRAGDGRRCGNGRRRRRRGGRGGRCCRGGGERLRRQLDRLGGDVAVARALGEGSQAAGLGGGVVDRKSTRLNSS